LGVPFEQVARAEGALPAAGAWDATPAGLFVSEADEIALHVSYDGDAAAVNPAVDIRVEISPRSVDHATLPNWFYPSVEQVAAFVAGVDMTSRVQRHSYITYTPTGLTEETLTIQVRTGGHVERLRVTCRESGWLANPGVVSVVLTAV